MKHLGLIEHGVYRTKTPKLQSLDYIIARLQDEDWITQIITPLVGEIQKKVAKIIQGHIKNKNSYKILEIGTGTGATIINVLDLVPNIIVEAVDISKSRLERCQVRLAHRNERVKYVLAEASDYLSTKETDSYDCIFTAFSLHNLPIDARNTLISQVFRVLLPGGVFVDADKHGLSDFASDEKLFSERIEIIRNGLFGDQDITERWIQHYMKDREIDIPRERYLSQLKINGFNARLVFKSGIEIIVVAKK